MMQSLLSKAIEQLVDPDRSSLYEVEDIFEEIVEINIRERKNIKDAISSLEELIQIRLQAKEDEFFLDVMMTKMRNFILQVEN